MLFRILGYESEFEKKLDPLFLQKYDTIFANNEDKNHHQFDTKEDKRVAPGYFLRSFNNRGFYLNPLNEPAYLRNVRDIAFFLRRGRAPGLFLSPSGQDQGFLLNSKRDPAFLQRWLKQRQRHSKKDKKNSPEYFLKSFEDPEVLLNPLYLRRGRDPGMFLRPRLERGPGFLQRWLKQRQGYSKKASHPLIRPFRH